MVLVDGSPGAGIERAPNSTRIFEDGGGESFGPGAGDIGSHPRRVARFMSAHRTPPAQGIVSPESAHAIGSGPAEPRLLSALRLQACPPDRLQNLENNQHENAGRQRQREIVHVQWPEPEQPAANGQSSVRPNIVVTATSTRCERRIWPAERRDQRRAEGAVDEDQADDRQDQRKECQGTHFVLRHTLPDAP